MAYTTIDDPSAYFQIATWTGNDTDGRSITNDGNSDLQPDLVWIKARSVAYGHSVHDSSRGFGSSGSEKNLVTSNNEAENGGSHIYGGVSAASSDGFTTFEGTDSGNPFANNNENSRTYVAWQWKANGGTTTTNDASETSVGSVDSVYQANTTAGFSIVTYTGTGSGDITLAHGLGKVPNLIMGKTRNQAYGWRVYHSSVGHLQAMALNSTNAASNNNAWGGTAPTSAIFTAGRGSDENMNYGSGDTIVAYCFAEIQGFSKFGGYTANNNDDGPFIYTGFKPRYVMIKKRSAAGEWHILDTKRESPSGNPVDQDLYAGGAYAEGSGAQYMDFLSNGFKLRSDHTGTNGEDTSQTYVYVAFAEQPFVTSSGVPATAR
tara:strand:+ start:572 stop:1699 length:1128 start_codon:yes stop_codon:yes gene_type:complete